MYELDDNGKPIKRPDAVPGLSGAYLGDREAIEAEIKKVASQAAKKKE